MRESSKKAKRIPIIAIAFILLINCKLGSEVAYASGTSLPIPANVYDLDKDSKYVIEGISPSKSSAIGTLSIDGDVRASMNGNSFATYEVANGNASFTYNVSSDVLNRAEEEWHIIEDKSNKVNGLTLNDDILTGALILQTSLDGTTWTEDVLMSDIFGAETNMDGFYTANDIQLQNGCYYRVIVAYKMEHRLEDSKTLFVTTKNYEYKQVVEEYIFYLFCNTDEADPAATPMKKLGSKINTGKDNGYSGNEPIDKDDPHYGWDIGHFYVNGYTRETTAADQTPVFLKNVGDKVTLWFHLTEDINKLHGNDHLSVSEDKNGYDRTFEINQTNFERGTLIIQYTNAQGEAQKPIIYTDYLAAYTQRNADTKVQLFEEGDYVVSLDYELKSMGGPFNQFASYTDYKIMFEFSIRNGNCMVYPFDNSTGAELADNAITENGFKLDMAKSRYLTIDVQRSVLAVGTDGYLTEDVRFNRPAKAGETYTKEGIYTFKVKNVYTGEMTEKTIYVGADSYLRALSATGMSIEELNSEIEKGAIVNDDGTIETIAPSEPEPTNTPVETVTEPNIQTTKGSVDADSGESEKSTIEVPAEKEESKNDNMAPFVIGAIAMVIIASVFVYIKCKKAYQAKLHEEEGHEE